MRRIIAKPEVCMACRLCEVGCKVEHSEHKHVIKSFKREKPVARLLVEESGPLSFATQCRHCDEPACMFGCITGAITKDPETGIVNLNAEKCIGCWTCILMCPYGSITRTNGARPTAAKCDMCPGREVPACVEACPNRALVLMEDEEPAVALEDAA
ncbi:MAG: 4Fe-4S dicluster domain-containing protein [Armatimonadetes bacterium]|nr:4Fe-4S dicluster domain-containing protein [Armatimonadota bacterium]